MHVYTNTHAHTHTHTSALMHQYTHACTFIHTQKCATMHTLRQVYAPVHALQEQLASSGKLVELREALRRSCMAVAMEQVNAGGGCKGEVLGTRSTCHIVFETKLEGLCRLKQGTPLASSIVI